MLCALHSLASMQSTVQLKRRAAGLIKGARLILLGGGGAPRSAAENVDYNEGTKCTKNVGSE